MIITVGKPALGCDVEAMVVDNDKRMNLVSCFLNYYWLMEANIKNYEWFSKSSNYDEETIRIIEEQIQYNKQQYDSVVEKILDFTRK